MSNFTKKPYIETVLAELSGENKAKLLNNVNGKTADGTANISYTVIISSSAFGNLSAGVTPVAYLYNSKITWYGYFVKTTNYTVFITFKNKIDLSMADIYIVDSSNKLSHVETCTSDNLRTLLREDSYIDPTELADVILPLPLTADNISSGSATNGQVLTADGDGGASWITPDKPIHFIKLESATLTEALRTEILSDNYFVIIEYYNRYYYEREKTVSNNVITQKYFQTIVYSSDTSGNKVTFTYYNAAVTNTSTLFDVYVANRTVIQNKALPKNIAGKDDSETNVPAGQVLMADGDGGASWGSASSTTFVDWS